MIFDTVQKISFDLPDYLTTKNGHASFHCEPCVQTGRSFMYNPEICIDGIMYEFPVGDNDAFYIELLSMYDENDLVYKTYIDVDSLDQTITDLISIIEIPYDQTPTSMGVLINDGLNRAMDKIDLLIEGLSKE